jgi:hypothetical protein
MKIITTGLYLTLINVLLGGASLEQKQPPITGFKLQLDQEAYFTDVHGKADPGIIANTPVGKSVRIYRTDGFCYTGVVTEIEDSETHFKIYGTINNVPTGRFGFVLAKGGIFAGAIVEEEKEQTYVLEFSPAHKGYVLLRTTKYNKPQA